jgi:hypothetical protein
VKVKKKRGPKPKKTAPVDPLSGVEDLDVENLS